MENDKPSTGENTGSLEDLGFIPPLPKSNQLNPKSSPTTGVSVSAADMSSGISEFINSDNVNTAKKIFNIVNAVKSGNYAEAARELGGADAAQLVENLGEAVETINVIKTNLKGDSGSDNPPTFGGPTGPMSSHHDNQTILSLAPHPTEVRLNTGIKPNTFVPEYNRSITGYKSPLHFNILKMAFPAYSASDAGTFFRDAVMFDLKTRITANITYSPASTLVDPSNLRNALNAIIKALSIYYSVSRLYVYSNVVSSNRQIPFNENEGINYLSNLAADGNVVRSFLKLKRLLNSVPIPPNLNSLVFYLHQFYTTSPQPGSPVLAIAPHDFTAGVPNLQTELDLASADIISYSDIYALISRAIPDWRVTPLLSGNGNFLHDTNFTTFWVNCPFDCSGTNGTAYSLKGPSVTSNDTAIRYNTYTNNLDGGIFALTSIYNTTSSTWTPSMFGPLAVPDIDNGTDRSSRLSWFTVGSNTGFYNAVYRAGCSITRDDTYTITSMNVGNTVLTGLAIGAEHCEGVTANVVSESCEKLMDWMLSWGSVPVLENTKLKPSGNDNPYMRGKGNKSKPRFDKGKGKK